MGFYSEIELRSLGLRSYGKDVKISKLASLHGCGNIDIANHVRIDDFCIISAGEGGVVIGDHVHIACYCSIIGKSKVILGDFSGISSRCAIYSSNDDYSGDFLTGPTIPDEYKNVYHADVYIGRHVIIGVFSTILPGVTIHDGAGVGAYSLVTKDVEKGYIVAGVPAKKIKNRSNKIFELEIQYEPQSKYLQNIGDSAPDQFNDDLLVSIFVITYNHEKYIAETLDSILSQKCTFPIEIIVGEDCSTDNTRAIILRYAKEYPLIITALLPDKNIGMQQNAMNVLKRCKGKYIAICEGDDYWIDKYKLQKQVDFLETNPDFTICFTDVDVKNDLGYTVSYPYEKIDKDTFSIEDFIMTDKVFLPTPTFLFRNVLPDPMPPFYMNALSGDIALHLLLADKGLAKRLSDKTAVYRQHTGGITKSQEHIKLGYDRLFNMYEQANVYFDFKYNDIFRRRLLQMSKVRLIYGARDLSYFQRIKHFARKYKYYAKYSDRFQAKESLYYFAILFFPSLLKMLAKNK